MSLKQNQLRDYLAENLPGTLVTLLPEAGHYQFVIFIPGELATHTLTFRAAEFDVRSIEELVGLLEANQFFGCIEMAAFSLDITFPFGDMLARQRPAA